ncbi:hypothetical protein CAPTEDRAFT_193376 [Capitella teleta]|uniref:Uncharacterized protein n=1 Tax=Capitella teleta TaxID=283909 RepID=R7TAG0_CAPTE|nr:hypothetical protein CAPTEDRAFT_193376 [Capitella teleta]|eukprot:ELT90718.1 hypothetical protein CAPTEDRAFT_193376 [Capitella teleta]
MAGFVWRLEYERRREKEFGIPSLTRAFSLGEQSERTKRENSVETRVLKNRLVAIRREISACHSNTKKSVDSMERLKVSIRSPVSAPLSIAEFRKFHSRKNLKPSEGREGAEGDEDRMIDPRKLRAAPDVLKEMHRRTDFRRPRSVGVLKNTYVANDQPVKNQSKQGTKH